MTAEYERYLEEFGERLREAGRTPETHTRSVLRPRPAAITALIGLAVTALVVVTLGLPGGNKIDAVALAQEALTPGDDIIHVKLTTTVVSINQRRAPLGSVSETWSATGPTRWRLRQPTVRGAGSTEPNGKGRQRHIRLLAGTESAYSHDTTEDYDPGHDVLRVTTKIPSKAGSDRVPSLAPLDPERDIRPKLERGELRDAGETVAYGRRVHRLVTVQTNQRPGEHPMTTYYVDAETGAPVGGELSIGTGPKWLKKSAPRLTFRVDTYQRFPDDQAHAYLLKIKRSPKTKIIVRSYAQVREKMRADRPINRQHRKQP